jgi:hypothetical protein
MALLSAQPNQSSIQHHISQRNSEPKPSGRREILTDDIYKMIVEFVAHRLSAGRPRTYEEILDQIEYQFNTVIQAATLRPMLKRKADAKTVI